ncbi:rubrerythrin family protein [Acidobacteriota bacterium]
MKAKTEKNLLAAFAGESQAHMKYKAFAVKAEQEGLTNIARLFKANSYAEQIHATNHLRTLSGIKATTDNLEGAIAGETYEVTEMYPEFISVGEEEGEKAALFSYNAALAAEKVHNELYKRAKEVADQGQDADFPPIHVCSVCGFTVEGDAPDSCPVCNAAKDKFEAF